MQASTNSAIYSDKEITPGTGEYYQPIKLDLTTTTQDFLTSEIIVNNFENSKNQPLFVSLREDVCDSRSFEEQCHKDNRKAHKPKTYGDLTTRQVTVDPIQRTITVKMTGNRSETCYICCCLPLYNILTNFNVTCCKIFACLFCCSGT